LRVNDAAIVVALIRLLPLLVYTGVLLLEVRCLHASGHQLGEVIPEVFSGGASCAACLAFLTTVGLRGPLRYLVAVFVVGGILATAIVDLWVYTSFQTRIAPEDLFRTWGTPSALFGVIGWSGAAALGLPLCLLSVTLVAPPFQRSFRRGFGAAIATLIVLKFPAFVAGASVNQGAVLFHPLASRLVFALADPQHEFGAPTVGGGDPEALRALALRQTVALPSGVRRVIVLTVEGLSAWYSQRSSHGEYDLTPGLDRASERGVLFTNFFANFGYTEGGILSLYSGLPPVPFRGVSRDIMVDYARAPSLMASLASQGFRREFFHGSSLDFLNMRTYLEQSFDAVFDVTNDDRFRVAPRYVFDGVADEVLYAVVLDRIRRGPPDEKLFLAVHTLTSHRPYQHPRGGPETLAGIWSYVDDVTTEFIHELEQTNFFLDGLLILTSDHDHYLPTAEERRVFGETAGARIPLFILGRGVTPGAIDHRRFQQADLLRFLDRTISTNSPLSECPVLVERYTVKNGLRENARRVTLFPASLANLAVRAELTNHGYSASEPIPLEAQVVLAQLRQQQLALEYVKATGLTAGSDPHPGCSPLRQSSTTECRVNIHPEGVLRWSWVAEVKATDDYWLEFAFEFVEGGMVSVNGVPVHVCDSPELAPVPSCKSSVLVALREGANRVEVYATSKGEREGLQSGPLRTSVTVWTKSGSKIAEVNACSTGI
jgi:Sulfatase